MNLVYDHKKFADLQDQLVDAIASAIKSNLVEAGMMDPDTLSAATYNITSDISAIIDSCISDQEFHPYLTFKDPDVADTIVHGKGSWLHERLDEDAINAMCGVAES